MNKDTIYREDAIKLLVDRACEKPDHGASAEYLMVDEIEYYLKNLPSADRSQGYWTKTDVATYRCSECGKIQIADDINELNFCCCCGSRNKIRRLKGADDEKL